MAWAAFAIWFSKAQDCDAVGGDGLYVDLSPITGGTIGGAMKGTAASGCDDPFASLKLSVYTLFGATLGGPFARSLFLVLLLVR
jgi:hypothetical protein